MAALPWLWAVLAGAPTSPASLPFRPALGAPASVLLAQAVPISTDAILAEMNRLRQNPAAYADWLERTRGYYNGAILSWPGEARLQTVEGTLGLEDAIAVLRRTPPLPPLRLSAGLSQAADDHAKDLIQTNRFSAQGSDGSTAEQRATRYGIFEGRFQELVSQGLRDPAAIVASLVIDDGNINRNYRRALLDPDYQYLGVRCLPQGNLSLCVTNFAMLYTDAGQTVATPFGEPAVTGDNPFTQPLTPEVLATLATGIIAETNAVRTNPAGYAAKLEALRPYYQGNLVKIPGQPTVETVEGVAALDEAIAALKAAPPAPSLRIAQGLNRGAADHANDIGPRGVTGHYGRDGSVPLERAQRYGTVPPGNLLGENVSFGPPTLAEWHVIQLIVDDDFPSRGHREAMLRPRYQWVGSACAPHAVFRIVCVVTYASAYEE
ncbi:MAG: hypothetical protein IGR92_12620 [Leptolyngbyaceae cyanobacterium T60_A2020_046]|nr:hypothetical protein [Leptolyngbyaceae cyanobacterium T60_A2020_046]